MGQLKEKVWKFYHQISGRKIAHYLHIGKTGGSAIKHALAKNRVTAAYYIQLRGHRVKLQDIPKGEKVFFSVRDPIDRFISAFYSRKRQGKPRYHSPWTPAEEIIFEQFDSANELAVTLNSNDQTKKEAAFYAMQQVAHLNTHYWDWFTDEAYLESRLNDIIWIGNLQQLSSDFEQLKLHLGLPKIVELPKDDFWAHKNPLPLDKKLSPLAKENLNNWYSEDYHFLEVLENLFFNGGKGE